MNNNEARRKLAAAGFALRQQRKTNELWGKGTVTCEVGYATKANPHLQSQVNMAIRRAAKEEQEKGKETPLYGGAPFSAKMVEHIKNETRRDPRTKFICGVSGCYFECKLPGELAMHNAVKHPNKKAAPGTLGAVAQALAQPEPVPPPCTARTTEAARARSA